MCVFVCDLNTGGLTAAVQVVSVHEGKSFIAVSSLLRVALIHGVHHHRHLLPSAAQRLLTLLRQFPLEKGKTAETDLNSFCHQSTF